MYIWSSARTVWAPLKCVCRNRWGEGSAGVLARWRRDEPSPSGHRNELCGGNLLPEWGDAARAGKQHPGSHISHGGVSFGDGACLLLLMQSFFLLLSVRLWLCGGERFLYRWVCGSSPTSRFILLFWNSFLCCFTRCLRSMHDQRPALKLMTVPCSPLLPFTPNSLLLTSCLIKVMMCARSCLDFIEKNQVCVCVYIWGGQCWRVKSMGGAESAISVLSSTSLMLEIS